MIVAKKKKYFILVLINLDKKENLNRIIVKNARTGIEE
jgi:hypothetical protein